MWWVRGDTGDVHWGEASAWDSHTRRRWVNRVPVWTQPGRDGRGSPMRMTRWMCKIFYLLWQVIVTFRTQVKKKKKKELSTGDLEKEDRELRGKQGTRATEEETVINGRRNWVCRMPRGLGYGAEKNTSYRLNGLAKS